MTFDFEAYQDQALTTALPSALSMDYLLPGLVAEIGEVFGKRAKAVRDGWTRERLREEVLPELADVLWFVAVISHVSGEKIYEEKIDTWSYPFMESALASARALLTCNTGRYPGFLTHILAAVNFEVVGHGSTLEAVAQANLEKLASRKARGVIGGSGDAR